MFCCFMFATAVDLDKLAEELDIFYLVFIGCFHDCDNLPNSILDT